MAWRVMGKSHRNRKANKKGFHKGCFGYDNSVDKAIEKQGPGIRRLFKKVEKA